MPEPTRAMVVALENTPEISDETLLEKAQSFAAAEGNASFDAQSIRTTGVIIWRLLQRLDDRQEIEDALWDCRSQIDKLHEYAKNARGQWEQLLRERHSRIHDLEREKVKLREALDNVKRAQVAEAPHSGTETSKAAAREIAPVVSDQRRRIMAALSLAHKGLTAQQLALMGSVAMSDNSIRPRLVELETLGWVERRGDTRPTRSGRQAAVWRLSEQGRKMLDRSSTR